MRLFGALLAAALSLSAPAWGRDLVDMAGHRLSLPDGPPRAFAAVPPLTSFLEVVAPEAIIAVNRPASAAERPYLSPRLADLPVVGGWFGNGGGVNLEALVALRPQVVVAEMDSPAADDAAERLAPLGTVVAQVKWDSLDDYPALFRFLGQLLGQPERGERLARYAERTLAEIDAAVAAIPLTDRPRVYYAQSADGLRTACADSVHLDVVRRAGGRPAVDCTGGTARKASQSLSLEQVIALAPDVIVTSDAAFIDTLNNDSRWRQVKAVAEGHVFLAPAEPYGWLDRPPLFTRLLGLRWAFGQLHGSGQPADEARAEFVRLFYPDAGTQTGRP